MSDAEQLKFTPKELENFVARYALELRGTFR